MQRGPGSCAVLGASSSSSSSPTIALIALPWTGSSGSLERAHQTFQKRSPQDAASAGDLKDDARQRS